MSDLRYLFVFGLVFVAIAGVGAMDAATLEPGTTASEQAELFDESELPAAVEPCAERPPVDFSDPDGGNEDVIGWVDGHWYNEPLEINTTDGLNETEIEKLSARTAARFEAMRCITADEGVPPVNIQTREEFTDEQSASFDDEDDNAQLFDNAKLETLMISETTSDSSDEREQNRAATVGGTYNMLENEITIVTDDPDNMLIDEEVLAHELGHAIQDQQFDLAQYDRSTVDRDKAKLGLIEGDVHLIEQRYLDACENEVWNESCITEDIIGEDVEPGEVSEEIEPGDESEDAETVSEPSNWGLYLKDFQPYSDGPDFVEHIYETGGGWDAVDALYEDPPDSALYVVEPELYGEADRPDIEVPDESNDEYERITFEHGPDYDTIGVAGISAMFMTPSYESDDEFIYPPWNFLNFDDDLEVDESNPLEYHHPETEGWQDDKLHAYRNVETNETGTVWELQWDEAADREPYINSYRQMIEFRGGQSVGDDANTYTFENSTEYEMALTMETDGDRVTIVTAPTLNDLDAIHDVSPAQSD